MNVLIYAFRSDMSQHEEYRAWLEGVVDDESAFGISDLVASGLIRVVTHPRAFAHPSALDEALGFLDALSGQPNAVPIAPGERHWGIFTDLCRMVNAKGNIVPDAYLAALAIESGSEWITTDRDYARFPGLRWHHPLDA
ncbi:MAG: type II toxin-antitoxin system VapC family toxin [Actinomycetota bacterium]